MAAKVNRHRYGTKLRHCHLMYMHRSAVRPSVRASVCLNLRPQQQTLLSWSGRHGISIDCCTAPPLTLSFQARKLLFCRSSPSLPSFSSPELTPRIPRTVYRHFRANPFLLSSFFSFPHFLVDGSVRYIKLTCVSFWAHVKIASRIVSYRRTAAL